MPTAPSRLNLYVGKGKVFNAVYSTAGVRQGWKHMGNVDNLRITTDVTKLTMRESMSAAAEIYDELVQHTDPRLRIQFRELTPNNARMHLLASIAAYTQPVTAVVAEPVYASGQWEPGDYVFLEKLGAVTGFTITFGATPGVLGTDYEVIDAARNQYRILEGTILTGAVTVGYTPVAIVAADGAKILSGGQEPTITSAFRYIGYPSRGRRRRLTIWKAAVSPDGDHDLITDDYAAPALLGTVLSDAANHPTTPMYEDIWLPESVAGV